MTHVTIGDATRIYALCEFPSQTPRYVGKTIQPLRLRCVAHERASKGEPRLPVNRWIAKRKREGLQICIKWLETVPPGADWAARERHWILQLHAGGADLLNLTQGGEGLPGHRFTDEHKAKIAASLRTGAHRNCLACGQEFWRKASEIAKGHDKFCSHSCSNKHNKGGWECRKKS